MTLLVALALLATPTPAQVGLTRDGKTLVYPSSIPAACLNPDDDDGSDDACCTGLVSIARDLLSEVETSYLVRTSGKHCAPNLPELAPLKSKADLEAFLAAHPIDPASASVQGPKGATLVGQHLSRATFACQATRCSTGQIDDDSLQPVSYELAIKRKDGKVYLVDSTQHGYVPNASAGTTFTPFWAPDESAVAIVEVYDIYNGRTGSEAEPPRVRWVRFEPVRVSVLGYAAPAPASTPLPAKGKGPRATPSARRADQDLGVAEATAAAIRKLGGYHVSTASTHDPRADTVVYAAKGFETDARKIAQAIPGAKVDKLTWRADADIVVACVGK